MDLLSKVINITDHVRLPSAGASLPDWYKEWYHFCIVGPQIEAIINFSIINDYRPAAPPGSRVARLIALIHTDDWEGDVEDIPARDVVYSQGRLDIHLGHNRLSFKDGVFRLSVALSSRPLTIDLELHPRTYPLLRSRATIGDGKIDWLVVPHLRASGRIITRERVYTIHDAPAYHDHNWGSWLWGQDFAWEWGFMLPVSGAADWSLVYDRMSNRARTQVQELKLSAWKQDKLQRIFAHHQVEVAPQGLLALDQVAKFPPIMALITPENTSDVPRAMQIDVTAGRDALTWQFQAQSQAQIVIPNETDLGETVINEVIGSMHVSGQINGEPVNLEGKGFFEYLT